jgi:hypothetical protein
VLLCLLGSLFYSTVGICVPLLHAKEARRAFTLPVSAAVKTARRSLAVGALAVAPLALAVAQYPAYAMRILGW